MSKKTINAKQDGYSASIQYKKSMCYVVIRYKDEGKDKSKWFSTGLLESAKLSDKKEALSHKLNEFTIEMNKAKLHNDSDDIYFHEYLENWINKKKLLCNAKQLRQSTFDSYENRVKKHFIPYFKKLNIKIGNIKTADIDKYFTSKLCGGRCDTSEGGLSQRTIHDHLVLLKQIFSDAINIDEIIVKNPTAKIKIAKVNKYDISKRNIIQTSEDISRFLKTISNEKLVVQLAFKLALYCGLRRSEVCGLKWESIDFVNNKIQIKHTVVRNNSGIDASDNTKTLSSKRTLNISEKIKNDFHQLKKFQDENKTLCGNCYIDSDYAFCWEDGRLIAPDYLTKKLSNILKNNGQKHMRFHDLRHSAASILFNNDVQAKNIQEFLGHSDISTTMNIYTHTSTDIMAQTCEKLTNILERN